MDADRHAQQHTQFTISVAVAIGIALVSISAIGSVVA
jgi:hypothetical protein